MSKSTSSSLSSSVPQPLRPIILVTGANSGLGFATCQRFLLQLSSPLPSDTLPIHPSKRSPDEPLLPTPFSASNGCTLLLACRNAQKAQEAKEALLKIIDRLRDLPDEKGTPTSIHELDRWRVSKLGALGTLRGKEVEEVQFSDDDKVEAIVGGEEEEEEEQALLRRRSKGINKEPFQPDLKDDVKSRDARARGEYRRNFCNGTKIEVVSLDLGSLDSVLQCAQQVSDSQPYLTHLVLNAGAAAFTGFNMLLAIWMMVTQLKVALTRPRYKMQRSGDLSVDGLGWVWQVNVGGSWVLTQALLPLLRKSPYSTPARIIFTSSVEALEEHYDPLDFQCLRTDVPSRAYESTKYQCDLAAVALQEQLAQQKQVKNQPDVYLTHPGVVATSIMAEFLNVVTATFMLWAFYLARWLNSPHHCVVPYKGSIAHTHTSLAARSSLDPQIRYASQCDFWGNEYVGSGKIDGWDSADEEGSTGGHVRTLAEQWRARTEEALKKWLNRTLPDGADL